MSGSINFTGLGRAALRGLHLCLLLAILAGCSGKGANPSGDSAPVINPPLEMPASIDSFPVISQRSAQVEEGYQPIAETDQLRLYIKQASSAVIVEDKRTGRLLRSSPADLAENKEVTSSWQKQIELPVQISYVDPERSQPKNVRPEQAVLSYQPVQGGVRVTYKFERLALGFDVVYSLNGDCLEASLPDSSVVESGENSLVTIDVLPFLGATHDGEQGYIVYPDGSGAVMDYVSPHPDDVQKMVSVTYGFDGSGASAQGSTVFHETIVMPVFGLVSQQTSFVGIVTHGDFDSAIGVARSGKGIDYNHVWAQVVFRRVGRFSLTGGQPAWLYQPDRAQGDRQVRYCLLPDKEASYVGMASRFRQFLIDERGAKRLPDSTPLAHLAFYMGAEQRTWLLRDMISMTTFNDARQILKDLEAAGATKIDISLWSWNRGGIGNRYPERLPVDQRLGSEAELKALAKDIQQRGQRLFMEDNYMNVAPGSTKVQPFLDAVRGVDGLPLGSSDTGYILNPQVAKRKFAARDFPKIAALGADGLELQSFASLAMPDKNTLYPLSRESFAATWMQMATTVRKEFGAVSLVGSNTYAVPYADRLDMVTMDSTHYDFFADVIPFYQIAIHGLVQYTGQPYNLISDGKRMYLRYVEYGSIPFFVLSQASSAELLRTQANGVYSSQYSYWRSEVIRQYQAMQNLAYLNNQFITGHEQLADGVFQTTYEDGSRVIVNYTLQPYAAGTLSVPPQDFILVRGD